MCIWARVQRSSTKPVELRCFIFDQLGCSGRLAYGAFGSCAMILKPVTSQNVDDRSAQRHLPVRVVAIVEHHVFFACQHLKYHVNVLTVFVHGDDERYMAFEPSVIAHVPGLSTSVDRLVAVRADLVLLPSHFSQSPVRERHPNAAIPHAHNIGSDGCHTMSLSSRNGCRFYLRNQTFGVTKQGPLPDFMARLNL